MKMRIDPAAAMLAGALAAASVPQPALAAGAVITPISTEISCERDRSTGKPVPASSVTTWRATFMRPVKAACMDGSEMSWQPGQSKVFTLPGAASHDDLVKAFAGRCTGMPEDIEVRHPEKMQVVYTPSCAGNYK